MTINTKYLKLKPIHKLKYNIKIEFLSQIERFKITNEDDFSVDIDTDDYYGILFQIPRDKIIKFIDEIDKG